jgi:hypothetical protein
MKKLFFAIGLAFLAGMNAHAGTWTHTRLGPFDTWYGSDGSSYTGTQLGPFYNWSGHDGYGRFHWGNSTHLGNFDFGYDNDDDD